MGAKIGHDLVLEAKRWNGSVDLDADNPAASSVQVSVDVASLEIVEASGGVKPLSDKDRGDIAKNIEKSLDTKKHPQITFQSNDVSGTPPQLSVRGDLTIMGRTNPVTLAVTANDGSGSTELVGRTTIVQTQFGIKPFSAMLGALKVKDEIELEVSCKLPSA